MPIDYGSRNVISGNNSPFIPLITDNPTFKVAIIPVDGRFEEKPNPKDGTEDINAIKVGDTIVGERLSGSNKSGKKVKGRVLEIQETDGDITAFKILDTTGNEVQVDPTTAIKIDIHGEKHFGNLDTNPFTESRHVMLYEEWKTNRTK